MRVSRFLVMGCFVATLAGASACDFPFPEIAPADDSALSEELRGAYRHLAEATSAFMHVGDDEIAIPGGEIDSLYNAMIYVHNFAAEDWRPGRDWFAEAVLWSTDELEAAARAIEVQTAGPEGWWTAWQEGGRLTGQAEADALMEEFGLEVTGWQQYAFTERVYFALRSPGPINTAGLAARWRSVPGIVEVSPDDGWQLYDWGNFLWLPTYVALRPEPKAGALVLRYVIGWGDCPSGCIFVHWWKFRVTEHGVVWLRETGGEPLPE